MSPSSILSAGSFEWGYVPEAGQPSTAELIACQSQDYIDERLQEFQATIVQLQSESLIRLFIALRKSIARHAICVLESLSKDSRRCFRRPSTATFMGRDTGRVMHLFLLLFSF